MDSARVVRLVILVTVVEVVILARGDVWRGGSQPGTESGLGTGQVNMDKVSWCR
jgi:hypothetical protein